MEYQETLNYMYAQLPMFTRVGVSAFKKDLTNTLLLCEKLGNPQHKFKTIHVGGTNGKGSTSHMMAAVLQASGYKTGLYTSPHLKDFRERIRIDGQMITEQQVVDFVEGQQANISQIEPSFFELTVAMAFDYFAQEQVDFAVIEVGLGGRLDSTNIINPELSIITNIGWDHMNLLGNTLAEIAAEKAGIIKKNVPVIIGEYQPEVATVFEGKASLESSELVFASALYNINVLERNFEYLKVVIDPVEKSNRASQIFELDLTGIYQLKNLKTVLAAVDELRAQELIIPDHAVFTALKSVKQFTGLAGRWQILQQNPLIICDTGHNPEGIKEVLLNIQQIQFKRLHFVLGMVADKDISKILALLPQYASYYFCKPDMPRGLDEVMLQTEAVKFNLRGDVFSSVKEAFEVAKSRAQPEDLIFAGGSTFVVAEIL